MNTELLSLLLNYPVTKVTFTTGDAIPNLMYKDPYFTPTLFQQRETQKNTKFRGIQRVINDPNYGC